VLERHAEEDLTERAAYIARENPAVAQEFLDAVERAFTRLADMPGIGSPRAFQHPRLVGIRMWPVPEYPSYLVAWQSSIDRLIRIAFPSRNAWWFEEKEIPHGQISCHPHR